MNTTKIEIVGSTLKPTQLEIRLILFGLRTARKIGDTETVNNTVLGKLRRNSLDIQIKTI